MALREHAAAQRHTRNLRRVVDAGPNAQAHYCQYLWRCNCWEDLEVTCFARSTNLMLVTTYCETLPLIVAGTAYFNARITSFAAQHPAWQVGLLGFAAIVV